MKVLIKLSIMVSFLFSHSAWAVMPHYTPISGGSFDRVHIPASSAQAQHIRVVDFSKIKVGDSVAKLIKHGVIISGQGKPVKNGHYRMSSRNAVLVIKDDKVIQIIKPKPPRGKKRGRIEVPPTKRTI